jgi:hypothetical protein
VPAGLQVDGQDPLAVAGRLHLHWKRQQCLARIASSNPVGVFSLIQFNAVVCDLIGIVILNLRKIKPTKKFVESQAVFANSQREPTGGLTFEWTLLWPSFVLTFNKGDHIGRILNIGWLFSLDSFFANYQTSPNFGATFS